MRSDDEGLVIVGVLSESRRLFPLRLQERDHLSAMGGVFASQLVSRQCPLEVFQRFVTQRYRIHVAAPVCTVWTVAVVDAQSLSGARALH